MKKFMTLIIFASFFLPIPATAATAAEADPGAGAFLGSLVAEQEQNLDLRELEQFILEVDREVAPYLPELSLSHFFESLKEGEFVFSPQAFFQGIFNFFLREVTGNLHVLGKLIIIAVVCAVLSNLQLAFAGGTTAKLAYFICLMALITIALSSFHTAVATGLESIRTMTSFMKLLLPVLLVLLTAMGGLTSASLLQPFLMVFLNVMGAVTQGVIFPLIYLTAMLSIANNISEYFKVSRLAVFLRQITKAGIGLVLTLFVGVITVEGVAGAVVDGVTLRTAKYMTGAFIPVAGGMFADALDAVMGGSLLLKNAVGLTGVLVLGAIVLFPVLKILAIAVIYRLASALLQPVGSNLIADTLEDMAGSLFLAFAAVASVAIMFFLTVVIIVGAANFTVMLR
ncbi:MAG: stage III sporulation protein AE [Clostridia bacterium]|jgi:stage III sporulation protein AE|nr:stage III sporulation protein AE [Clostridia bacterium]